VLAFLGGLHGLAGALEEGRRLAREAETIYEEIGEVYSQANNSGRMLARIELLSGDAVEAERILRDCCSTFERLEDQQGLSTLAAEVADALYLQARYDEAAGWIELAQGRARGDDVSAQFSWRRVGAKLVARRGGGEEGRKLASEAEEIVATTDDVDSFAMVLLDAAEVRRLSERPEEAAALAERALASFKAKGNVVSAGAAEALLRELAPA
jgi:tetratricopeptide (TPR) repeat protein